MRREKQLKGWTRAKKDALTAGKLELLKKNIIVSAYGLKKERCKAKPNGRWPI